MATTVTISIEIELGWGYHDLGDYRKLSDDRKVETRTLANLLDLCDRLQIPISFDVVGHLLLSECDGDHDGPHPDGWFAADPGTDVDLDPLFYAPDLVRMIDDASVDHEICTHTFSHILCNEMDSTVLNWELERVCQVHEEFGLSAPESLVTPRNQLPNRTVLGDHGIETLRVAIDHPPDLKPYEFIWNFLRVSPTKSPGYCDDIVESYVVDVPTLSAAHLPCGSKLPHPAYQMFPTSFRQRLQKWTIAKSLKQAIKNDSSVHYWTHLHDIANPQQWVGIVNALNRFASAHDVGDIRILTMAGLADRFGP